MSAENVSVAKEFYEHWAAGDFTYGADVFSPDLVFTTFDADGDQIVRHGLDGLTDWLREFLEQWKDYRIQATEIVDLGDRLFVSGTHYATGKASGAPLEMPIWTIWTFRDGKLAELLVTRHEEVARSAAGAP